MSKVRVVWTLLLPFVVHYCLKTQELLPLSIFLGVGAVFLIFMLRSGPPKTELERLINGFGPMLASSMCLGILFVFVGLAFGGSGRLALALPALSNLAFLLVFAGSLALKKPIVQRFARLFHPDLSPQELSYCTGVTWLWVAFFTINIAITLALAALGNLTLWTIHTGAVSYIIAGLLGVGEYIVRKKRFGRFTERPHDRLLRKLLNSGDGT